MPCDSRHIRNRHALVSGAHQYRAVDFVKFESGNYPPNKRDFWSSTVLKSCPPAFALYNNPLQYNINIVIIYYLWAMTVEKTNSTSFAGDTFFAIKK